MSIDRWIDKEVYIYKYNEILLNDKKGWNIVIYNNMDGPQDYGNWNRSDRKKHSIWYYSYVEPDVLMI